MRLSSAFYNRSDPSTLSSMETIMNEVTVHRGKHAQLTSINATIQGELFTEITADGYNNKCNVNSLLLSTPTGSTAYSLSAGTY